MIVDVNWMSENYDKYNQMCWNGKLPRIILEVDMSNRAWGRAYYKYDIPNDTVIPTKISMSNYYDSPESVKLNTLLHEMVHIADYTFHPEHFFKNRRANKRYNAHGHIFFLKEAQRLTQYGFDIQKNVTEREKDMSELSQKTIQRGEKKVNNGLFIYVCKYKEPMYIKGTFYKYCYAKNTMDKLDKFNFNDSIFLYKMSWIALYQITKPEGIELPTSTRRFYCCEEITDMIEKYGLNYVSTKYVDQKHKDEVIPLSDNDKQTNLDEPSKEDGTDNEQNNVSTNEPNDNITNTQDEITDDNKESQKTDGKVFVMKMKNGSVIEIENTDPEYLYKYLKNIFILWSDDTIKKIINNPNFYKMKDQLKENLLEKAIRESINEIMFENGIGNDNPYNGFEDTHIKIDKITDQFIEGSVD